MVIEGEVRNLKLEIEKSLTILENSIEGNFEVKVSSQENTQQITEVMLIEQSEKHCCEIGIHC